MDSMHVFDDKAQLAQAVADETVKMLDRTITEYSNATWVLAGGTAPMLAYKIIAANHADALDWTKVTVIMGDERIGPLDSPDNNWQIIDAVLGVLPTVKIRPMSDLSAEEAAEDYSQQLAALPTIDNGLPRLDVVWLGMGQDGHTLSLFPAHNSLLPSTNLVIPVHDSPKPPSDRISLSLRTLQGARNAMIITSGSDKKHAVTAAQKNSNSPIALAASIITTHEGTVGWYIDKDAAPTD